MICIFHLETLFLVVVVVVVIVVVVVVVVVIVVVGRRRSSSVVVVVVIIVVVVFVCLFVGGKRSRGLPLEDLPEEPCYLHLICRHDQVRQGDLHRVPSPGALQLEARPQDVLQVLLLPTMWARRVRPLDPFPGFPK
jgi:hypothetical protein